MFDFDASKLLIVGVIALVFIPSKDLPRVLRQVGQFVAKARKMASEFQGQFMDAMKEADMADLRREAQKLAETARVDVGLDSVTDLKTHMTRALDGAPSAPKLDASVETAPAFETMDGAGMKDPNGELSRLAQNSSPLEALPQDPSPPAQPARSPTALFKDGPTPAPIEHSAS